MLLPDPRIYPTGNIKNSVIAQLNAVLAENDMQRRQEKQASLVFLLNQYLEQDKQEALVVALSLAPSQFAYQYLWDTIKSLVMPADALHQAQIFALPLIIVAGAPHPVTLPAKLTDIAPILQQLKNSHIIHEDADIFLSAQLYTGDTLAGISLPQLYRWQQALQYASGGLPINLTAEPISLTKQGVFLRYLLGVAMRNPDIPTPIKLDQEVSSWGLAIAESIQQDLQQEGLTLFAIPRQPQALLEALDTGQHIYLDIAMQVFASDAIKKYRDQRKTPTASIACHENHEVKLIISSIETPSLWEGFVWPLQALDHPADIGQQMQSLLQECQLEEIVLLTGIQPAQENGTALFITPAQAVHYQHTSH
jgi:hypothetical protein